MDLAVEQQVWRLMQQYCFDDFQAELTKALRSYKRRPGYSALTRLHAQQVGIGAIQVLTAALRAHPHCHAEVGASGFIQLRLPLRMHLCQHLHTHLIQHSMATEPLLEAYLAQEVGL
ncbi:hypothetical protein PPUN110474_24200 [Pseudomonas putida]|nr:hypothetical protein PPUN110474_24200 [Pseudomonas putida]